MSANKILICIPTYNEAENAELIFKQIKGLKLNADILFVDDNSPDGTGVIIDRLKERNPNIHVIHRLEKRGIGSAHLDGIHWAHEKAYKTLITMDCDFSHSPVYLPEFIKSASACDVVLGSRYKQKGSLKEWNFFRKALTHIGHFLTKSFLKMPYDATGAFRLYRIDRIPIGVFNLVRSRGYSFFFESLYVLYANGHSIKEVPIHLPARTYGHSKMKIRDARDSLLYLVQVCLRKLINKESLIYSEPFIAEGQLSGSKMQNEWDAYWLSKKRAGAFIYDLIAGFYRRFIIRPALNHFVKKHFGTGSEVLHAGCGSGRVDTDVSNRINISALDISVPALEIYRKIHKDFRSIVHASIFEIPMADETFDGIYNLGVMEHFTEDEIQKILIEFHRVLKPNGKVILFWPPEFGLSVIFLKLLHFFMNKVLKKNIILHPREITRVKSKEQIKDTLQKANFAMDEFYFGIRDLFTYAVVISHKEIKGR